MYTFNEIWTLLEPKIEYANLINKCRDLWESLSEEKRQEVFLKIERKKIEHKFVDYNPLLALRNNANIRPKQKQILSFSDYYAQFGTTEEQNGWRRVFIKEQQKTVFVKE